jgi:DNA invertase Pin-like site-specific DNA recombinase
VSGLGLEAQRHTVEQYADRQGVPIVQEFVETESGKRKDRPELSAALAMCRKKKAVLLIAKLDRLARNVSFISSLMETGVEFVAVDAPFANKLLLHVLAAVAEFEREQISERTRAALKAAKARGVILGANGAVLAAQKREQADLFAASVRCHVEAARAGGRNTYRGIGDYLTQEGVSAPGGGVWHPNTVSRVMDRLGL